MQNKLFTTLFLTGLLGLAVASTAVQAADSVSDRLQRIENLLDSQGLVQLLSQLEQLQQEVQSLRGEVEEHTHGINQIKKRQRDLYLDVDRRLRQMEAGASAAATAGPVTGTAATGAGAGSTAVPPSTGGTGAGTPGATTVDGTVAGDETPAAVETAASEHAYQKAFSLLKQGRYDPAIKAFAEFLSAYPASKYADNAQYWLGEAYYVTRRFKPALGEFNKLVDAYPDSPKLTHALLKIGYIHHELGEREQARAVLNDLRARFPGSTAARLADDRLQRMKLEEH